MTRLSANVALGRGRRSLALALLRLMGALAASLVAACGSMTVQVDVIDPAYVETVARQAQLQTQLSEAFRPAGEKEARYRQIRADLSAALAQQVEDDEIQLALSRFDGLISSLRALDQRIRQAVAEQPVGGPDVTAPRLRDLLLQRQAIGEAGVENVLQLLDEIAAGGPTPLFERPGTAVSRPVSRSQIEADLKSITGGFTLAESAHAYAIASAPKEKWAPEFNRTFGRGTFGNLNFAVKMVSLADFTIKGVTFDPSKVAQVASKVTTQSLLLAAQIAGVPVARPGLPQTATGGALAAESEKLAPILAANQRFAAQEELRQEAIVAILTRIAEEEGNLRSGDPAIRSEAHRAILATYEAYKGLLTHSSE